VFLDRLMRLAAFQNPEFYRAQAMRLSTFGKPRVIACAEDLRHHIGLPRGLLKEVLDLFDSHRIAVKVTDHRFGGIPVEFDFQGDRRPTQIEAAKALAVYDEGVLCAPQQYVGRLHRLHADKRIVRVYDYVDAAVPVLNRMYEKRVKAYEAVGYSVARPSGEPEDQADLRFATIERIAVQAVVAF
jgi:hypothetical protein